MPLKKVAYVTGASKGIGKSLTHLLLSQGYFVCGISRTNSVDLKNNAFSNFNFIQLDLNDLDAVKSFQFDREAEEVLLINNAGIIGEIMPVGKMKDDSIQSILTVNTIAPQILMNKFIHTYIGKAKTGHILNISSGAGKNPIDAWASYCASKAALDLFSETIQSEFISRSMSNWHIHAVAPGVVDTEMQNDIRKSNPIDFKVHEKFVSLKNNNELSDPNAVAKKLFEIITNPQRFKETLQSVREY